MQRDLVLRVAAKVFLPWVLLFAVYVLFHGHYGAGGGFQAGVIAGAGIILYGLLYGVERAERLVPVWLVDALIPLGVLIYAGVGVAGLFIAGSGNYLDYSGLIADDPAAGQYWGIFAVEVGVFLTVSATMLALFHAFAGRGRT